jgi:hypothetical protein
MKILVDMNLSPRGEDLSTRRSPPGGIETPSVDPRSWLGSSTGYRLHPRSRLRPLLALTHATGPSVIKSDRGRLTRKPRSPGFKSTRQRRPDQRWSLSSSSLPPRVRAADLVASSAGDGRCTETDLRKTRPRTRPHRVSISERLAKCGVRSPLQGSATLGGRAPRPTAWAITLRAFGAFPSACAEGSSRALSRWSACRLDRTTPCPLTQEARHSPGLASYS